MLKIRQIFTGFLTIVYIFILPSCGLQAKSGFEIPIVKMNSNQFIFSTRLDRHYFDQEQLKWKLCRDNNPRPFRDGTLINIVLGEPDLFILGHDGDCQVTIVKDIGENPYSINMEKHGCHFYFEILEKSINHIFMVDSSATDDQYIKCLYRVGLFPKGYNGALDFPDADLFYLRTESFWAPFSRGPKYVPLFQYYVLLCDFQMRRFESAKSVPRDVKCQQTLKQRE